MPTHGAGGTCAPFYPAGARGVNAAAAASSTAAGSTKTPMLNTATAEKATKMPTSVQAQTTAARLPRRQRRCSSIPQASATPNGSATGMSTEVPLSPTSVARCCWIERATHRPPGAHVSVNLVPE
jgi:hypothetical protein